MKEIGDLFVKPVRNPKLAGIQKCVAFEFDWEDEDGTAIINSQQGGYARMRAVSGEGPWVFLSLLKENARKECQDCSAKLCRPVLHHGGEEKCPNKSFVKNRDSSHVTRQYVKRKKGPRKNAAQKKKKQKKTTKKKEAVQVVTVEQQGGKDSGEEQQDRGDMELGDDEMEELNADMEMEEFNVDEDEDEDEEPVPANDDKPPQYQGVAQFLLFKQKKSSRVYLGFLDSSDGPDNIHFFNVKGEEAFRQRAELGKTSRIETSFYPCFYDDGDNSELVPSSRAYSCTQTLLVGNVKAIRTSLSDVTVIERDFELESENTLTRKYYVKWKYRKP